MQPLKQFSVSPEALSVAILLACILRPSKASLSNTWGILIRCFWYLFFKRFFKYTERSSISFCLRKPSKFSPLGKTKLPQASQTP